jgi:hypothetical protein
MPYAATASAINASRMSGDFPAWPPIAFLAAQLRQAPVRNSDQGRGDGFHLSWPVADDIEIDGQGPPGKSNCPITKDGLFSVSVSLFSRLATVPDWFGPIRNTAQRFGVEIPEVDS